MEDWAAEREEVNRRLDELAREKSFLQLMVHLFNEIIPVSGLEELADSILQGLLNVIGGTGLFLYCRYDGTLHYTSLEGDRKELDTISDTDVEEVFRSGIPRETVKDFDRTLMSSTIGDQAITWVYPLKQADETFGVVKIENIPLTMRGFNDHLAALFSYIAMALQNEIRSRDRLKKAYDELTRENSQRRLAEKELRRQQKILETRVSERTAELVKLNAALREGNEAYQAILNSTSAGFWRTDYQGRLLDVNRRYEELSGYSRDELLVMSISDLEVNETPQETLNHIQDLARRGYGLFESRHRRKDGTVWDAEVSCSFPTSLTNEFFVFLQDISPRKRAEEERARMEKFHSLGVLAGGIAHDFNNILTGILGNISLARTYLADGHRALEPLRAAEDASGRAGVLARQLLTFSRGGAPVKKTVCLKEILNQALGLALGGSNVKGIMDLQNNLDPVEGDEAQLGQSFQNLILNARQSMPAGGTLTIRGENTVMEEANLWKLPPGPYAKVTFQDRGCGIPEADLARIFDLYFTTRGKGAGLGLPSVQSVVSRHGGAVSVDSRVGEGTAVTLYLPAAESKVAPEQAASGKNPCLKAGSGYPPPDHADDPEGAKQPILVMDDEELIRNLVREILNCSGYTAVTCADGEEAVELYREAQARGVPFAAVITDLTVPGGMGGAEAAREILAMDPGACLIVSSGYSQDPVMANPGAYGFCAAVAKPYRMDELGQTLASVLAGGGS